MTIITLKLKEPKHGNTQDAWRCIHQSLKPNFREGWTEDRIQKDLANGDVSIQLPNEQEAGDFLSALAQKGGLDFFTIQ